MRWTCASVKRTNDSELYFSWPPFWKRGGNIQWGHTFGIFWILCCESLQLCTQWYNIQWYNNAYNLSPTIRFIHSFIHLVICHTGSLSPPLFFLAKNWQMIHLCILSMKCKIPKRERGREEGREKSLENIFVITISHRSDNMENEIRPTEYWFVRLKEKLNQLFEISSIQMFREVQCKV